MKPYFSIIIPVYNSEVQVEKCLRSCAEQNIPKSEFEIIVVNDGSTDGSLNIINYISKEYPNFTVIDKLNGGVSSARNAGIEIAIGEYLWFVDSDDFIEKDSLLLLKNFLRTDDLDMLQIGFSVFTNESIIAIDKKYHRSTDVMSPDQYISSDCFIGGACLSIVKAELVHTHEIEFDANLNLAEDQIFMLTVLNYSIRVKRIIESLYYYYTNPNGATHNPRQNDLLISISKIINFKFNYRFKTYCDKLIIQQFLISCKLSNINIQELNILFRNANISRRTLQSYINDSQKASVFFLLYNSLGLPFLRIFKAAMDTKKILLDLRK